MILEQPLMLQIWKGMESEGGIQVPTLLIKHRARHRALIERYSGCKGRDNRVVLNITQKKVEPKRCLRGAVLENGSFLQGGVIFL